MNTRLHSRLADGLADMAIPASRVQQDALLALLEMLVKWNSTFNLTAVRDPNQMVGRHLLDSLSILTWIEASPVLDVGTGAGFPGLPLAIAKPDVHFVLLDSNSKKTRFVRQAVQALKLDNVDVMHSRIEDFAETKRFKIITSRAFSALDQFVASTANLLAENGFWLAMKGKLDAAEQKKLVWQYQIQAHALTVPGEPGERHAIVIQKKP